MANELTALPDMTLEEAQLKHSELKSLESVMRSMLLEMRDRKGWLALGFESWADYGDKEWNYGRQYLDRLATSARIEKQIAPMGANEIPERHLRPMAKIPESEIAAIWEESNRKAEELGKDRTAKMVQDAVNEWKLKHDTVQNDLIAKTQQSEELQRKVNFQATTVDAVKKQNEELRNRDQQLIDAKVGEEKAKLLLENSVAIQSKQKEVDDAHDALAALSEQKAFEINKLKSDQGKEIEDGVRIKLNELDNDIKRKKLSVAGLTESIEALRQTKSALDNEVGALQKHSNAIARIKDLLGTLAGNTWNIIDDDDVTPTDVLNDWISIDGALDKLKSDVSLIIGLAKSTAIEGDFLPAN